MFHHRTDQFRLGRRHDYSFMKWKGHDMLLTEIDEEVDQDRTLQGLEVVPDTGSKGRHQEGMVRGNELEHFLVALHVIRLDHLITVVRVLRLRVEDYHPVKCGSSAPRSPCHKAVLSPVVLTTQRLK